MNFWKKILIPLFVNTALDAYHTNCALCGEAYGEGYQLYNRRGEPATIEEALAEELDMYKTRMQLFNTTIKYMDNEWRSVGIPD